MVFWDTSVISTLIIHIFGWVIILVFASWFLALLYPLFARLMVNLNAGHAAFFTLTYSLLAPVAATIALLFMAWPGLAFILIPDHCHGNNCDPHHLYAEAATTKGIAAVSLVITGLAIAGIGLMSQLLGSRRRLQTLKYLSESATQVYRTVESREHLAWCAGFFKPQVYLSSALIETLSQPHLQAILTHELTHAIRRDNLRNWLMHWATAIWPKYQRVNIRKYLSTCHECICDIAACNVVGVEVVHTAINQYASGKNVGTATGHHHLSAQQRLNALTREFDIQRVDAWRKRLKFCQLLILVFSVWLLVLYSGIRYGHPLVEVLSQ